MYMDSDINHSDRYGFRCFGNSIKVSNNSWETGLNGNDIIFGTSGSGKTRGYVLPNILRSRGSIITVDSKNLLYKKTKDALRQKGYRVELIDFEDMNKSTIGYNPLDFVKQNADGTWSDQDIQTISSILAQSCRDDHQPFWQYAAQALMEAYITFTLEALPEDLHRLDIAQKVMNMGPESNPVNYYTSARPDSHSAQAINHASSFSPSGISYACVLGIANTGMRAATIPSVVHMYKMSRRIDFKEIAMKPTAVFINVSDSDRSKDVFVSYFYNQLFTELMSFGRTCPESRLPVPVRIFMDDFASGTRIEHFDQLISVIRSYDISVSVILQSLTQLYSMYGEQSAKTITNNCDHIMYLGGQDIDTIRFVAEHADKTVQTVMGLPLDRAVLITRGKACAEMIPNLYTDLYEHQEELLRA